MSENKRFQLVAWTEGQNVKMIPSARKEVFKQFLDRITYVESQEGKISDIDFCLELSQAYESYARALLRCGYVREALRQMVNAGSAAIPNEDRYWYYINDEPKGSWGIDNPFKGRFFSVYSSCKQLITRNPELKAEFLSLKQAAGWGIITDWWERTNF